MLYGSIAITETETIELKMIQNKQILFNFEQQRIRRSNLSSALFVVVIHSSSSRVIFHDPLSYDLELHWSPTGTSKTCERSVKQKLKDSATNYTAHTASDLIGYKPSFQLLDGPSPGAWSDIWLVSLARINLRKLRTFRLIHLMKRAIRSIASVILFVSLSAVGADRFDEPKLLSNRAKKRFRTYFVET